ncbi:MAG TPA: hypothetical protein VNB90_15040 [Cytophagaceae bacterium]|nr:hypothetical protein [Cytophagaceae bacterium]
MRLNKIKLYRPNSSSGGGNIVDQPYDSSIWDADTTQGASRNAIRDKIESMGYNAGNVLYVDGQAGDDTTARRGNILKPYQTPAMASVNASMNDLIVVFPGNYVLGSFGLPLKYGVNYYMWNPTFINTEFSYGLIMTYPYPIKSKIFGKATFTDYSPVGGWAMITPYMDCDLEFEGMTFISNKQLIGQLGSSGLNKILKFKNCKLISNDNDTQYYAGGGFAPGSATFEDCYLQGNFLIGNAASCPGYDFKLKFSRCELVANDTNTNGDTCFLRLVEYYENAELSKVFLDHCVLRSSTHNIEIGEGYGGIGTNKYLIIKDCYFYNSNGSGWIKNEHANAQFKLVNNWSTYAQSGSVSVVNLLPGPGITCDSNLE